MVNCRFCETSFMDDTYLTDDGVCGSSVCQSKRVRGIKKYRKKPVVVEAEGPITQAMTIKTLEGDMRADVGDYIITGVKGERYPCKPDIFHETYEPVEDNHV